MITPFPMTPEDERFARAVITANMGKDMLGAAKHIAEKIAEQHVSTAVDRYARSRGTSLESIASLLGGDRRDLVPFLRQAAVEGKRVRVNERFAVEMTPESIKLIAFPA